MIEHFRRLHEHMTWADQRILEALRAVPDAESLRLLSHLLAAEEIWLARLTGADASAMEIWPPLETDACEALAQRNRADYCRYLDSLRQEELAGAVRYRNSRGVEFATSRADILTHVMMHGSYHRGQIAASLRRVGAQPPNTDFIAFAREEEAAPAGASRAGATGLPLLAALLLTGCAGPAPVPAVPAGSAPLVRGEVQALDHRATASAVLVSGGPGSLEACGISATVDAGTRIVRQTGDGVRLAVPVSALAVGDTVEVHLTGEVAESCPVQGRPDSLVIVHSSAG